MIKADQYFKDNLASILTHGYSDENPRAKYSDGTQASSRFITQVFEKYDIYNGEFPITTLRNTAIKTGIKEILWIYQKQSNSLLDAHDMGIKWWDEWNIGNDTIGIRYGETVRRYNLTNELLYGLKMNPFGRRHILNLYQYSDLSESEGLYPCAYETIWSVRKFKDEYVLDMTLIQRSSDYITANYINKSQYVSFMLMVARSLGYKAGIFAHFVQNLHIYDRHIDAAKEILFRQHLDVQPSIELKSMKSFYDYTINNFTVKNIENIKKLSSKLEIAI